MELSINALNWFEQPKKAIPAQVIKFNRFAMVFNSAKKFKAGQLIMVNLTAGLHTLREVRARIEMCERSGPYYQCQIRFVLERPDKQPYREAIAVLKALEQAIPASIRSPLHMQP